MAPRLKKVNPLSPPIPPVRKLLPQVYRPKRRRQSHPGHRHRPRKRGPNRSPLSPDLPLLHPQTIRLPAPTNRPGSRQAHLRRHQRHPAIQRARIQRSRTHPRRLQRPAIHRAVARQLGRWPLHGHLHSR